MMYAYLIKGRKSSGKQNLFVWFESKSDSRADREVMNILEDAEVETGRGADHQLPVRTDMPVFDDLPEENELDATWCDRYELAEDNRTWRKIVVVSPVAEATAVTTNVVDTAIPENTVVAVTLSEPFAPSNSTVMDKDLVVDANDDDNTEYPVAEMNFSRRLLSQFTSDATRHHIKHAQRVHIMVMSLDTDNSYVQNLLLAASNTPELQSISTAQLWRFTNDYKTALPMDKRHELNRCIQFSTLWVSTEHIDRGVIVREWAKGNYITSVQRTATGTNAGGGNMTDRNPDMVHTLETLDLEIASALLPFDFNIYDFEHAILRRAKEMVAAKESPWKEWSRKLRNCPGILDYSRAAIFAIVRGAAPNIHITPGIHQAWISANLTETDHANPSAETLAIAMRSNSSATTNEISTDESSEPVQHDAPSTSLEPEVKSLGSGVFSIEGLIGEQPNDAAEINTASNEVEKEESQPMETGSDVQMAESLADEAKAGKEVQTGETADVSNESHSGTGGQTITLNNEPDHHINELTSKLYTHFMVDLETMGSAPDAPIVSIGAVPFDPSTSQTGAEFYKVICLESAMSFGGVPDAGTILWWMKQSSEARAALLVDEVLPLDDVLLQLNEFISENSANGPGTVQVWGNGATFDNVLLRQSYKRTAIPCPWSYRNDRDVRTIVELGRATFKYETRFPESNALKKFASPVQNVSTFGELCSAYHAVKEIEISASTMIVTRSISELLTLMVGPKTLLTEIQHHDVLLYRKRLLEGEFKARVEGKRTVRTVNSFISQLCRMLKFAHMSNYIQHMPFENVKMLKKSPLDPDPLMKEELESLSKHWEGQFLNLWIFAVYSGLRHGELAGLAWEDVDLENAEVHIKRTITLAKQFGPPKTSAGIRTVKLLKPALEALTRQKELTNDKKPIKIIYHYREHGKTEPQWLRFCFMPRPHLGWQSRHYSTNTINRSWEQAMMKSGVRHRTPYHSRHTYACWLLSAGANPSFIANQMGHSDAQMVYSVYSKWIVQMNDDQVGMLNAKLG